MRCSSTKVMGVPEELPRDPADHRLVGSDDLYRAILDEEVGAPGYDPLGPAGANYNLLIGHDALDPVSGSFPHRATCHRSVACGSGSTIYLCRQYICHILIFGG